MSELRLNAFTAGLRVCVDKAENDNIAGRVYSQRLKEPFAFQDMMELVMRADAIMDEQNFPQAFRRMRSMSPPKRSARRPAKAQPDDGRPYLSAEEVAAAEGEVGTFIIRVVSRQNVSWQGHVYWGDGSDRVQFGSLLELIRIVAARFGG